MENDDIIEKIQELLKEKGWTAYRLAKESGLSESSIRNILIRRICPKITNLEQICNAFGITLEQFFKQPEERELLTIEEKELLYKYGELTSYHKEMLHIFLNALYDMNQKEKK